MKKEKYTLICPKEIKGAFEHVEGKASICMDVISHVGFKDGIGDFQKNTLYSLLVMALFSAKIGGSDEMLQEMVDSYKDILNALDQTES